MTKFVVLLNYLTSNMFQELQVETILLNQDFREKSLAKAARDESIGKIINQYIVIRSSNVNRSLWSSFYVYRTLCLYCAPVSLARYEKVHLQIGGEL